jgi:hypothetical protein
MAERRDHGAVIGAEIRQRVEALQRELPLEQDLVERPGDQIALGVLGRKQPASDTGREGRRSASRGA